MAKKKTVEQTAENAVVERAEVKDANPNLIWVVSVRAFGTWTDMTTLQMATNSNPIRVDKTIDGVKKALVNKAIKEISAEKALEIKKSLLAKEEEKTQKVSDKQAKKSAFEQSKNPVAEVQVLETEPVEPVKSEDSTEEAV